MRSLSSCGLTLLLAACSDGGLWLTATVDGPCPREVFDTSGAGPRFAVGEQVVVDPRTWCEPANAECAAPRAELRVTVDGDAWRRLDDDPLRFEATTAGASTIHIETIAGEGEITLVAAAPVAWGLSLESNAWAPGSPVASVDVAIGGTVYGAPLLLAEGGGAVETGRSLEAIVDGGATLGPIEAPTIEREQCVDRVVLLNGSGGAGTLTLNGAGVSGALPVTARAPEDIERLEVSAVAADEGVAFDVRAYADERRVWAPEIVVRSLDPDAAVLDVCEPLHEVLVTRAARVVLPKLGDADPPAGDRSSASVARLSFQVNAGSLAPVVVPIDVPAVPAIRRACGL